MPGLFSVYFSKSHFTDEVRPVDQFLKGVKDGSYPWGAVQGARFRSPTRGRWMSLWMDVLEV